MAAKKVPAATLAADLVDLVEPVAPAAAGRLLARNLTGKVLNLELGRIGPGETGEVTPAELDGLEGKYLERIDG